MSLDSNTRAAANMSHDRIHDLINHFTNGDAASWGDFGPGQTESWLEQTKMDLVALASCLESRIQQIGHADQDIGI